MSEETKTAKEQIRSFVERAERLNAERKALSDDLKELYAEAKGSGFDKDVLKQVIKARDKDPSLMDREENNAIFDVYWDALQGPSLAHAHEEAA